MKKQSRNKVLITNLIFLVGILFLFLNDQFFKFSFSNFLTGKISDILGLIIFPFLLTYLFPKLKEYSVFLAAFIFAFWKSEYSQNLIDFYNSVSPIETSRVIDYSDFLALFFLPIPFILIKNSEKLQKISFQKLNEKLLLIPIFLILIAEAPPIDYYYSRTDGNLRCHKCTTKVNYSTDNVMKKLRKEGFVFDSIQMIYIRGVVFDSTSYLCFKKELILGNDTLRNIDITLRSIKENKTKIYFNGMNISKNLTDKKLKRKLRKYYRELIFNEIKNKL